MLTYCQSCDKKFKSFDGSEKECKNCAPDIFRLCTECGREAGPLVYNMCMECVKKFVETLELKGSAVPREQKKCKICNQIFGIDKFYKYGNRKNCYYPACKECHGLRTTTDRTQRNK